MATGMLPLGHIEAAEECAYEEPVANLHPTLVRLADVVGFINEFGVGLNLYIFKKLRLSRPCVNDNWRAPVPQIRSQPLSSPGQRKLLLDGLNRSLICRLRLRQVVAIRAVDSGSVKSYIEGVYIISCHADHLEGTLRRRKERKSRVRRCRSVPS